MRGKAAKTKRVSSPDDLENEYYKPTRPKKSENSENGENQNPGENRLVQVSYPELKKKGYLTETNPSLNNIEEEEEKNNSEHHKKVIIKKAKPSNFEKLSLADVLDCKFTPENIHFRDKEISEILTFIADCLNSKKNDSLFVTGNPGTGKTLTLNHALNGLRDSGIEFFENRISAAKYANLSNKKYTFKVHNFNAMSYKNPLEFYGDLYEAMANKKICEKSNQANFGIVYDELKSFAISSDYIHLAFVDEVDNLFNKLNSMEIFEMFKLPKYSGSKLFLFGASNTIDLLIKLNQQYKLSMEMKNIVFQPYNFDEILNILKGRISNDKFVSTSALFDEFGLKYCAKKISALKGGDIRCALDVVKKVYVEKVGIEKEKESAESKIMMEDMVKVFEQFYGKKINDLISTIPQIQKTGLVGLYMLLTRKTNDPITKADFMSAYNKVAEATSLMRASLNDIDEILQAYTTYQFVNIKNLRKTLAPSKLNTSMKCKNEELVPLITSDQIKEALINDEFFSRFFES